MASRVGSAALALTAGALLAASIVTNAWWSGHPTVNASCSDPNNPNCRPQVRKRQDVYIGPLRAEMCNTGGDGTCKTMPHAEMNKEFLIASYTELGASGLLALGALLLGALVWVRSDRRKTVGAVMIILTIVAAGAGAAMVFVGPTQKASVPIGYGLYVFLAGAGLSMVAAMVAMLPISAKRGIVLKSGARAAALAPPPAAAVDLAAIMQDNRPRPASVGPEPKLSRARDSKPPPVGIAPSGSLPGPAGPLGAPSPLFASAPQLPFDTNPPPGTSGVLTKPVVDTALTPPMIPRHPVSAVAGIPTPPSVMRPSAPSIASTPPIKPPSIPPTPPSRPRSMSATPPPMPRASDPEPTSQAPGERRSAPSMPPPLPVGRATPSKSQPAMTSLPAAHRAAPLKPPPARVSPPARATSAPAASPIVTPKPPAVHPVIPIPPVVPFPARVGSRPDLDGKKAAETTPAAASKPALPEPVTDVTSRSIDGEIEATPQARQVEPTDRDLPVVQPASATPPDPVPTVAEAPPPATEAVAPPPAVAAAPPPTVEAPPSAATASKPPMSTAPESLPPPQEKESTTSGPTPACPQCEAPMAWVEAHLRFYCKPCKMYF